MVPFAVRPLVLEREELGPYLLEGPSFESLLLLKSSRFFRVPQQVGKRSSITFFQFWSLSGHFFGASVTFFVTVFCQTPFAGFLLRQGDLCPDRKGHPIRNFALRQS